MKTVILNSDGLVENIGVGEPGNPAPEGYVFVVVEDDVWVSIGCKQAEDGTFFDPAANPAGEV